MPIHLVAMGMKITRKCGGLPLAVKSIACLLRHEVDEEVWTEILESDIWENKESKEEIFPALQISYAHLPAHLKPCFLFLSMYPKDYILSKKKLIRLWIAHGYIGSRSNRKIIEIGVEYYNELKERSFLDDATKKNAKEYCKLHDIIHDLARLNSENEHYSVEINQPLDIQERTVPREAYHLYVTGSMGMRYVNRIPQENIKGIRTYIQECNRGFDYRRLESWIADCPYCLGDVTWCNLTQFEVLRVLILKWHSLTKIPCSISQLKHLTYLSIRSYSLKELPLSIGLLYNLLALKVKCETLEYLAENIGNLAKLQFLRIDYGDNLKKLPKSLCSLTNLLELTIDSLFLDYEPHGIVNFPSITTANTLWNVRTLGWLKDMKDLKGKLCIRQLKNINNLEDAKHVGLRNKCKLECLQLCWEFGFPFLSTTDSKLELYLKPEACEGRIVGADDVHFSLLQCLQPHPNLNILILNGYPSAMVPRWMRDPTSLQSIQTLRLYSCGYIESLSFGNLHTLKHLEINCCSSIRTMQQEQLPSHLETLLIEKCDRLELIAGLGHLDMLKSLHIFSCRSLKSITMDGEKLVESTELFGDSSHGIPQINRQSISSLTKLWITDCVSLHSLPDGLIPSGPCDVCVQHCGCLNYKKSIQESSSSHNSDGDEGEDNVSDDDKSNQGSSSSHHTSMSNIEDDVEDEGEDDDTDDDKSN